MATLSTSFFGLTLSGVPLVNIRLDFNSQLALFRDETFRRQFKGYQGKQIPPDSQDFSQPASGRGLSVEAWIRPDTLVFKGETDDPHIHWLGKGEAGRHEWGFRFYSKESSKRSNRVSAYIWNPDGRLGAGAYFQDTLTAGQWIHVVATYDPGDKTSPTAGVSIYKNGVLRGGPTSHPHQPGALYRAYDIMPVHGSAPLRLGTRNLQSFLVGGLDEIAIYPRVLTADEILDNYKCGTTL